MGLLLVAGGYLVLQLLLELELLLTEKTIMESGPPHPLHGVP